MMIALVPLIALVAAAALGWLLFCQGASETYRNERAEATKHLVVPVPQISEEDALEALDNLVDPDQPPPYPRPSLPEHHQANVDHYRAIAEALRRRSDRGRARLMKRLAEGQDSIFGAYVGSNDWSSGYLAAYSPLHR